MMIATTPIMTTIKISYLFTKYFESAKKNNKIPGLESSITVDQNAINKCSLGFLVDNCGKFDINIVDDPNLNNELLNTFAQTFVRHFWNDSIGYDNELSFWFKLKAFFDENLPLWAQYFKEAIINNRALITSVAITKGNNVDVLHVEGSINASGTNHSDNSEGSQTSDTGFTNTDSTNASNDKNNNKGTSTDRNTGRKLNANADTPQDQLNMTESDDPLRSYNFDYASNVDGEHNLNYDETSTNSNSENDHTGNNNDRFSRNLTSEINNKAKANGRSKTDTSNTTDQTHTNIIDESHDIRNANVFELAQEMNELANGAYMNLFKKMKQTGLFLCVY